MGATPGEPSTTPASVWWLMGLGIAGLALVAGLLTSSLTRLRRRDRSAIVDDDALSRLLVAGLASGASERLGLMERPVIPTRTHGFLSLKRIRRLASDGRLASSVSGEGAPWLAADVVVLDDDHPRIRRMRSFLPDRPRLDRLRGVGGVMTSGPLGVLQRRVDAAVAGVALRVVPGDAIREVLLHTVDGRRHQVLVGEDLVALNVAALAPRLLRDVSALRVMRLRELLGD